MDKQSFLNDPKHWRERAEEARTRAAPSTQLMEYENSERPSEDFYGGLGRLQIDLLRSVSRAACHGKPGPLQVRCRARTHAIHCLSRG